MEGVPGSQKEHSSLFAKVLETIVRIIWCQKAHTLGIDRFALNSGSSACLLCDLGALLNLSVPWCLLNLQNEHSSRACLIVIRAAHSKSVFYHSIFKCLFIIFPCGM